MQEETIITESKVVIPLKSDVKLNKPREKRRFKKHRLSLLTQKTEHMTLD